MIYEPRPYDLFSSPAPAGKDTTVHRHFFEVTLARGWGWLTAYSERQRQRKTLRTLDDRMLADLGLTRAEVSSEAEKWPWQL